MERNQATAFSTHLEAKKKLQESVALSFFKGGWKFGWRMGIFAMTYVGISTTISVYRNEYTVFEYIAGGMATGALYKWKMGPRGMFAGGCVGGFLGTFAGLVSIGLLKLTGTTMEEVRYWQYKWKSERINAYHEGLEKQSESIGLSFKSKQYDDHDKRVGTSRINLDELDDGESSKKIEKPVVESLATKQ
jgi:O-antigen ligase